MTDDNGVPCVVISTGDGSGILLMNGQEYHVTLTPIDKMTPQQILDAIAEDELRDFVATQPGLSWIKR